MKSFEDMLVVSNTCPIPSTLIMRPNRALWFCIICLNYQSGHLKTRILSMLQFNIHQKTESVLFYLFFLTEQDVEGKKFAWVCSIRCQ